MPTQKKKQEKQGSAKLNAYTKKNKKNKKVHSLMPTPKTLFNKIIAILCFVCVCICFHHLFPFISIFFKISFNSTAIYLIALGKINL